VPPPNRNRVLVLLATAELLAMSLWFTGTAVLPALARQWHAGLGFTSWLTISVQLGFVLGALVVAIFNLSDVFSAPRIFVLCALAGAATNALFALVAADHIARGLLLRALTGAFLAGVYPTGMKILAGWFREGRGLALGILVGALTIGSALPHGVQALGTDLGVAWRGVVFASSALAVIAALIVALGVHDGPYSAPAPRFEARQIGEALRNRGLRLANLGYLGHMWELYSMWGWIAVLLASSAAKGATWATRAQIEATAFFAIGIGAIGCIWAGRVSDRADGREPGGDDRPRMSGTNESQQLHVPASDENDRHQRSGFVEARQLQIAQRSRVTILAMAVSGACCIATALAFDSFPLLIVIAMIWGVAVIADSAQFSAIISELADQRYVGTALTMQTAIGFLLTTISLRTVAAVAAHYGWRWAAANMAVGPALGVWAMWKLKRTSDL
jgi:MFS family permease